MGNDDENLGAAFGLVVAAGASTAIGASVVFFPSLVKYASRKTLAGGLGLSAGVMTYVSFVEIFQKSVTGFEDSGLDEDRAYLYATLSFFGGVVLMVGLNVFVLHLLAGNHDHHHNHHDPSTFDNPNSTNTEKIASSEVKEQDDHRNTVRKNEHSCGNCEHRGKDNNNQQKDDDDISDSYDEGERPLPACCAHDPVGQLNRMQEMTRQIEEEEKQGIHDHRHQARQRTDGETQDTTQQNEAAKISHEEARKLHMMSLHTAIAIALHNFPEGLATFVAALSDPKVGAVLAIAVAIHNIPEGLCVAMPVYYATGNRCKAFMWAVLSGVSEPIAALLGWAVLANSFSDATYGVLFGMVAGMMVIISVRELLPTAHRYDPEDSVVTNAFMLGMAIMAISLVLFLL